jgi:hypothetical protein
MIPVFAKELRYRLPIGESPDGVEWNLLANDFLSHSTRIHVTVKPYWLTPRLSALQGADGKDLPSRGESFFVGSDRVSLFASAPNQDQAQRLLVSVTDRLDQLVFPTVDLQIPANGRTEIPLSGLAVDNLTITFATEAGRFESRQLVRDQEAPTIEIFRGELPATGTTSIPIGDLRIRVSDGDGSGVLSGEVLVNEIRQALPVASAGGIDTAFPANLMPSVARTGDRILVSAVDRLGNRKEISVPVLGIDFLPISRDHLRDANGRSLNLDSANAYWSRTPIVTVRLPEFPEGAERMVWRGVESDTRGERTRATAANPIRFTIPKDGILDVSWEWVTSNHAFGDGERNRRIESQITKRAGY